jgi:hypothetical protein
VAGYSLFTIAQEENDYTIRSAAGRAWPGTTESKKQNQREPLVVEHDIEESPMHAQSAIPAQPALVIDEPQLAKRIHEETDARGEDKVSGVIL